MKFQDAVEIVSNEPLFETGLLLAGSVDPADLRRQLSRWTRSGRIHQLRRGLYVLAPPWRKHHPHPFLVANRLAPGSYVSGLSALAHAGAIPEYVPETTSITAGRPQLRSTPLGRFSFRHMKPGLMFGYRCIDLEHSQSAFVAEPEKAVLDMVHLHPGGDRRPYLEELRLDFDTLRLDRLEAFAAVAATPKLIRAARVLRDIACDAPACEAV
jgi:predicted transcriptional regulator of viral defense system